MNVHPRSGVFFQLAFCPSLETRWTGLQIHDLSIPPILLEIVPPLLLSIATITYFLPVTASATISISHNPSSSLFLTPQASQASSNSPVNLPFSSSLQPSTASLNMGTKAVAVSLVPPVKSTTSLTSTSFQPAPSTRSLTQSADLKPGYAGNFHSS
ncbi:hypothetical protein AA313_de0206879 [Arthrobotrys entomopaga]|nr:hypothetical protein AA313_de0206879 [Arthrobotrys entomopaga]